MDSVGVFNLKVIHPDYDNDPKQFPSHFIKLRVVERSLMQVLNYCSHLLIVLLKGNVVTSFQVHEYHSKEIQALTDQWHVLGPEVLSADIDHMV